MARTRAALGLAPLTLVLCLLVPGLAACASAPGTYPPQGVDELVVPTPTPQPSSYVDPGAAGADLDRNAWVPLAGGHAWDYAVEGGPEPGRWRVSTGARGAAPVTVDGVPTVAVTTRGPRSAWTDYYALDRRGDVWWFGHQVSRRGPGSRGVPDFRAGQDGAQAGLVMAHLPRRGDGYRPATAPGLDQVATVLATADDTVVVGLTTPQGESQSTYRAEVGLLARSDADGASWALVAHH